MTLKIGRHNLRWWFWSGTLAMIMTLQTSCITGPPGPQGPPGPAGNLALAGKVCPQGGFLMGFDANGNIICGFAGPAALTTVDSVRRVHPRTAMAIGRDGLPVISYPVEDPVWHTEHLKVVHCGNASCSGNNTITTVDSSDGVGQYCDIAIGSDGLPVISYWDRTNLDLKVAHCGNVACTAGNTLTTVDSIGNSGYSTTITIGRDGLPVISYYDASNHALKVVHCGKVDCSAGNAFSQVDNALSYQDLPIAIGGDGLPVIGYSAASGFKVAHCGNVDCSANNTISTVLPAENWGVDCSAIAIRSDGLPVISCYDNVKGDLLVMHCGNASCSHNNRLERVDEGILLGEWGSHWHSGKVGLYSAIAIGRDGLPVISYYDHTNAHPKVVHCGYQDCSSHNAHTTVDYNDGVGLYSSIAIGNDGLPVISYFDLVNETLKVAHCVNAKCTP